MNALRTRQPVTAAIVSRAFAAQRAGEKMTAFAETYNLSLTTLRKAMAKSKAGRIGKTYMRAAKVVLDCFLPQTKAKRRKQ